jgi:glycine hydroxymethyltransferase
MYLPITIHLLYTTTGGVRLGSPAMTTRGMLESDFKQIAEYLHRGVVLAKQIQAAAASPKLVDFKATMTQQPEFTTAITELRNEVQQWSATFDFPGGQS